MCGSNRLNLSNIKEFLLKWKASMPEERKKPERPEIFFLPPLKMVLSFFDREARKRARSQDEKQKQTDEKTVTKLIEKLTEKEDKD